MPPIRVAVNISIRQFMQNKMVDTVASILKETGLDPRYLDLELTESLLIEDVERTIHDLQQLHDLGVQISIDDFGTGYSSLSYLKQFRIDTLKIDRSFVKDATTNPDDAAISCAIINIAHSLRMRVIAEGVETREHMDFLKDADCDEMQGYYFGRPTDPDSIARILAENKVLI